MADQPNVFNTLINPVQVQTYERYLPSAFDEGMTLLEKVNKVIIQLNRIGKLSNDVLDQWNQVMDWVMADGLDASIDAKINSMLTDGSLATIIGNAITNLGAEMGDLTTLSTTAKDTIVHAINEIYSDMSTFESTVNSSNSTAQTNLNNTLTNVLYYGTPEQYGAKGDGVTDDTVAIQNCLNACKVTAFQPKTYKITTSLKLPKYHSIEGNNGKILVSGAWTANTYGASVPVNTILWMEGKDSTSTSDIDMSTCFIKDLKIQGDQSFNLTGLYLGVPNQTTITDSTTVNYSVINATFTNVSLVKLYDGLVLGEVWQSSFNNIQTHYILNNAFSIKGQSVNNTFTGCLFDSNSQAVNSVLIDHGTYNGINRRPEGNMFIGGFIGSSQNGVRVNDSFALKFSNVIIDLNTSYAIIVNPPSEDTVFSHCYIASSGGSCLSIIDNMDSSQYGRLTTFRGCNFIPLGGSTTSGVIGQNQQAIFDGCQFTSTLTFASNASGSVINNLWNQIATSNPLIVTSASGNVFNQNNYFKLQHTAVVLS